MDGFFWQKNPIFQKNYEGIKLALERDWISKISQNVQVLVFPKKKTDRFSEKKTIFLKTVELRNLAVECDWISDISQHVQKLRFRKQDWLIGKKPWVSLKTAKSSQFDAECNRISKFSLSVQKLGFLLEENRCVSDKILDCFKMAKSSKFALQWHWEIEIF